MKTPFTWTALSLLLLCLLLALSTAGCASSKNKIDWNSRIGTYTYDQAVLDLGPPAKEAKLQDGTIVAEWMTQRGHVDAYYPGPYYYPYRHRYYGPAFAAPMVTSYPDVFLRLTFNPEGKLTAWKKVSL
jgi:hypothetical protein